MIFGKPCIQPTTLANIIKTKLIPKAEEIGRRKPKKLGNRAIRTLALKTILLAEARKHPGFVIYPDNSPNLSKPMRQWLWDLVWWNDRPGYKRVELAVESEWNLTPGEIIYDFEKLMAVKSPLKVMVYRVNRNTKALVEKKIRRYLLEFGQHLKGECYIFCEFQRNGTQWTCECRLFKVPAAPHGRIKNVKYRSLLLIHSASLRCAPAYGVRK